MGEERHTPVDGGNDRVQGEARVVQVVLMPDGPAVVFAIVRRLDGVINGHDHRQQPAGQREHLVPDD